MSTHEHAKAAENGSDEDGRRRLQIDFSPKAYKQLLSLRRAVEVKTNTELVRMALRLLEWFLKARMDGFRVQLVKDDVVKEVEIMF
jgi:hypothetical protein